MATPLVVLADSSSPRLSFHLSGLFMIFVGVYFGLAYEENAPSPSSGNRRRFKRRRHWKRTRECGRNVAEFSVTIDSTREYYINNECMCEYICVLLTI